MASLYTKHLTCLCTRCKLTLSSLEWPELTFWDKYGRVGITGYYLTRSSAQNRAVDINMFVIVKRNGEAS